MGGRGASTLIGRAGGSTIIAVVIASGVAALQMGLSDEELTGIDYTAQIGRSATVAGGGALAGALATGLVFAVAGSEVPIICNIIGFIVGFVGSLIIDAIWGDDIEQGIRTAMGEGGCTEGVGPRRRAR